MEGLDPNPVRAPTSVGVCAPPGTSPSPRRKTMLSSLTSLVGHTPPYSRNRARVTFRRKETPISPLQSCKGFWRIPVLVTGPCYSWWLQRRWTSTQQDFKQDRVQDNWPAFPSGIFQKQQVWQETLCFVNLVTSCAVDQRSCPGDVLRLQEKSSSVS